MCTCLWQSLIVLTWPCAVDRMLKFQLITNLWLSALELKFILRMMCHFVGNMYANTLFLLVMWCKRLFIRCLHLTWARGARYENSKVSKTYMHILVHTEPYYLHKHATVLHPTSFSSLPTHAHTHACTCTCTHTEPYYLHKHATMLHPTSFSSLPTHAHTHACTCTCTHTEPYYLHKHATMLHPTSFSSLPAHAHMHACTCTRTETYGTQLHTHTLARKYSMVMPCMLWWIIKAVPFPCF